MLACSKRRWFEFVTQDIFFQWSKKFCSESLLLITSIMLDTLRISMYI